jgi:hypothetical protein
MSCWKEKELLCSTLHSCAFKLRIRYVIIEEGVVLFGVEIPVGMKFSQVEKLFFAIPGALTLICPSTHLPRYLELSGEWVDKGIDDIYCLSVSV